jgi:hypothetical protein
MKPPDLLQEHFTVYLFLRLSTFSTTAGFGRFRLTANDEQILTLQKRISDIIIEMK